MVEQASGKTDGVAGLAFLGLAWGLVLFTLAWGLQPTDFSVTFGALVLGECAAFILARGGAERGRIEQRQDAMAQVLIGWVLLCVAVLVLYHFDFLPFFAGHPLAILTFLALALILSLLGFATVTGKVGRWQGGLRLLLWVAAWQGTAFVDNLTPELALGATLLIALFLLFAGMVRAQGRVTLLTNSDAKTVRPLSVAWYADLMVMPMLLTAGEALVYLIARVIAQVLISAIALIGHRAQASLSDITAARNAGKFNAMAARLNLGLLLVGGGLGVVLLTVGDYVPRLLGYELPGLDGVLGWLVLAAAAPAFFGATETLMYATAMQRHGAALQLATCLFFAVAVFSAPTISAAVLAQTFAAASLVHGLVAAILLARTVGVWPGLTAVLLKQIKLL